MIDIASKYNNTDTRPTVRVQLRRSERTPSGGWKIVETHGFTIKGIDDLKKIEEICTRALKKTKTS